MPLQTLCKCSPRLSHGYNFFPEVLPLWLRMLVLIRDLEHFRTMDFRGILSEHRKFRCHKLEHSKKSLQLKLSIFSSSSEKSTLIYLRLEGVEFTPSQDGLW